MGTNAYKIKNHLNLQPGSAPSNPVLGDIYCNTSGDFQRFDGTTWVGLGGGASAGTEISVAQPGHGWDNSYVGKAIRSSGVANQYTLAKADSGDNAEVVGIISEIVDTGNFKYVTGGLIDGLSSLTPNTVYFLDPTTFAVTATEPSVVGQISKPLYIAVSTTTAIVLNMRGTTVGGTNVSTVIPLTLATSTVIQNISAWPIGGGGKINGTITVLGPATPQGCRVEISFQKRSNTSYEVSAAFPASSIVAATGVDYAINETNGNISIILPTITNATSASITFSIDSAALGATLPLQIDSNLISWREPTMFRNRFINSACLVSQRGTVAAVNNAVTYGGADRFFVAPLSFTTCTGNTLASTLSAAKSGVAQFFEGATTGSGTMVLGQRIEAKNVFDLNASNVTFTGGLYQDTGSAVTVTLSIDSANTVDNFGTVTNIGSTTISVPSGVATRFSFTQLFGATSASRGISVTASFPIGAVTAKLLSIFDWQIEKGNIATPFEFRPYGSELALCQRYYEKSYNVDVAPGTNSGSGLAAAFVADNNTLSRLMHNASFKVQKRALPVVITTYSEDGTANSVSPYNNTGIKIAVTSVTAPSLANFAYLQLGANATDRAMYHFHWVASSEL